MPEGCTNFRDAGGSRMRRGLVFRADDPTRLTEAGRAEVDRLGLSAVIDLRQQGQFDRGVYFAPLERTFHVPLVDRVLDLDNPPPMQTPADMAALYFGMLEQSTAPIGRALDVIAERIDEGPVLVHCVYGKDRTGLVIAALHALLGSDREWIVTDYARSDGPTNQRFEIMAANPIPGDGPVRRAPRYLFNAPAQAMEIVLDRMTIEHGSLTAWAQSFPTRPDTHARLRAALGASAGE